jgi:hypothetical protein
VELSFGRRLQQEETQWDTGNKGNRTRDETKSRHYVCLYIPIQGLFRTSLFWVLILVPIPLDACFCLTAYECFGCRMLSHGYEPNKTSIRLFSLVMEQACRERKIVTWVSNGEASFRCCVLLLPLCLSAVCSLRRRVGDHSRDGRRHGAVGLRWGPTEYVTDTPCSSLAGSWVNFRFVHQRFFLWCFLEAHLFWWYYKSPQRQRASNSPEKPWPTVLWLQGGPVRSSWLVSGSRSLRRELCSVCLRNSVFRANASLAWVRAWRASFQGVSGIGAGNFVEIGPLDADMKPRNSTWLQKADLIFVVRRKIPSLLLPPPSFAPGTIFFHGCV